uniref:ATP-dependent DNA helicase n=1 Tax=Octopus bimaculoides TaxID=37653 RepID=A0A0L8IDB3_OCTBM
MDQDSDGNDDDDDDYEVDNFWILPYNRYLTIKYSTHINVEVVHSVQSVKCLYNYITKGQDRIIFSTSETGRPIPVLNEIENFVNARYISARKQGFRLEHKWWNWQNISYQCHHRFSEKTIVLATSLCGIAATLLHNGRTYHSRFKVPINITPESCCNVSSQDVTAQLFRMSSLIIADEVNQCDNLIYNYLDRSLCDIRANESPFGGLCIGKWKQIRPVVKHGSRAQIGQATFKTLYIWRFVTELNLKKNVMVPNSSDVTFVTYLIDIGSGQCSFSDH